MADGKGPENLERHEGEVAKLIRDFGFVHSPIAPGKDIYFHSSWISDSSELAVGDIVTFQFRVFEGSEQAYELRRIRSADAPENAGPGTEPMLEPISGRLLDWAYMRHVPTAIEKLAELALPERWEFREVDPDPDRPKPILYSYLLHTFGRLVLEGKVSISDSENFAAFNTGLVDPRYEPIYALFRRQQDQRAAWQLADFCTAGERGAGQNLVRYFNPLPEAPHYFDEPVDLLYDVREGEPEVSWRHVVIERIDRFPSEFLDEHWPPGFQQQDPSAMSQEPRRGYFKDLGDAIEGNPRIYRRIMNRVRDALDLCIKRVSWNFKTAVPQYYPPAQKLQLLLPMCLVRDDVVDLALAVERTASGNYLAYTVLPLHWAYKNARLICRPDSDWLAPQDIVVGGESEDDAEEET